MTKLTDIGLGTNSSQPISIKIPKIVVPPKKHYGTVIHQEIPVVKQESLKEKNEDSVLDTINTGFGHDNAIYVDCPKKEFHQHLCQDNFLAEFKTEAEKALARNNLGIYSKEEVKALIPEVSDFVTNQELQDELNQLDFVISEQVTLISYNIPDSLFT